MNNGTHGIVVLGSVVLCITGCEALYADLGHFGRNAIRLSWFSFVLPTLLCNYFGQGALLLAHPEMNVNPFYKIVPEFLLYPMIGLSTIATVIASQALISGAFSLTQQAVQLGFCPRVRIVHTSSEMQGQIYIPFVNYALMIACIMVVIGFKESGRTGRRIRNCRDRNHDHHISSLFSCADPLQEVVSVEGHTPCRNIPRCSMLPM